MLEEHHTFMLKHISVLSKEILLYLNIKSSGIYVDATLGGGGHSKLILEKLDKGFLYAFDHDLFALQQAQKIFLNHPRIELIHSNFVFLQKQLHQRGIFAIDGIIFDLGLSSFQIDDKKRGFSYLSDDFLDMRMDQRQTITAHTIINNYSYTALKKIFFKYGQEKKSSLIAAEIIRRRPLNTTSDLVKITDKFHYYKKGHSAKKVFQALRIEVNQELSSLANVLEQSLNLLKKGASILVISFHSLEDQLVKHFFRKHSFNQIPHKLPFFNLTPNALKIVNKKVITPTLEELSINSRSHSAKLRVAIKNY